MSAQTESWPRPHRLTVHDYYRMAEVGVLHPDDRTELIEGEIVDMPPIGDRHGSVVRLLTTRLVRAVGDAAEVSCQLPVRLSLRSEPQPDFAIVKAKQGGYRKHPHSRDVLLLVEVSDSTLRYTTSVSARASTPRTVFRNTGSSICNTIVCGATARRVTVNARSATRSRRVRCGYRRWTPSSTSLISSNEQGRLGVLCSKQRSTSFPNVDYARGATRAVPRSLMSVMAPTMAAPIATPAETELNPVVPASGCVLQT